MADQLARRGRRQRRARRRRQTFQAVTPTARAQNRCQISSKSVVVSGTQDAVSKAGRKQEIVYQVMKRGKELRRDMEFILTR